MLWFPLRKLRPTTAGVRHVGTNGPFPTRHAAIRVWLVVSVAHHLSPTKNDEEPKISPALTVTPSRPSRTAVLTAVARALHREEPPPWVLDDPLRSEEHTSELQSQSNLVCRL